MERRVIMKQKKWKKLAAVLVTLTMYLPLAATPAFAKTAIPVVNITITTPETDQQVGSTVVSTTTPGVDVSVSMHENGDQFMMGKEETYMAGRSYVADIAAFADSRNYEFSSNLKVIVNGKEIPFTGDEDWNKGFRDGFMVPYYFGGFAGQLPQYSIYEAAPHTDGVWRNDNNGKGWWYQYNDGSYPHNGWTNLYDGSYGGGWYYMDADGYAKTGWFFDSASGYWFYLDPESGRMKEDWQTIDGKLYYFSMGGAKPAGAMYRNEKTPDGYTADENGVCSETSAGQLLRKEVDDMMSRIQR